MYADKSIIIIGAGFSGVGLAIQLNKAGFYNIKIFERESDVGGTWQINTYPGIAVDTPSSLYCYSFEPKTDWTCNFAEGPEIWKYISDTAHKYDVYKHITFNVEATEAKFNEKDQKWHLTLNNGEKHTCDILLSAIGALVFPKFPSIKGLDKFKGKIIHSAKWEHEVVFKGKSVAVLGVGSSSMQIIPELAKQVEKLTVFQRSAPWVVPKRNYLVPPFLKKLYKNFPFLLRAVRYLNWLYLEYIITPALIKKGIGANISRGLVEKLFKQNIEAAKLSPQMIEKVTPDYEMGCKRICMSSDYYPALAKDNVNLVTDSIDHITKDSIVTKDGKKHKIDILVCATGFDVMHSKMNVIGSKGVSLKEYFDSVGGAEAYKGTAIAGFPNYFLSVGPNTISGAMSMLYSIEIQINYIVKAIQYMAKNHIKSVDVKKPVMDAFNVKIHKVDMKNTTWTSSCGSWYKNENDKIIMIWPDFAHEFEKELKDFVPEEYNLKS